MGLTQREQNALAEIETWAMKLEDYPSNDFARTYDKWLERSFNRIPEDVRSTFFSKMDDWLFHLNALIQGASMQIEARQKIILAARALYSDIEGLEDLKRLSIDELIFLADHQMAKHRLLSAAQGGFAGTGGTVSLGIDLPLIVIINLRAVQMIATTYGYGVNTPYEMMLSLKVFHAATMPKRMQAEGWAGLLGELESEGDPFFYEGSEDVFDQTWMDLPLKQVMKGLFILFFRKKLIQGIPLAGVAIGAGMNYQLTRKVTDFANHFYLYRHLKEKGDSEFVGA